MQLLPCCCQLNPQASFCFTGLSILFTAVEDHGINHALLAIRRTLQCCPDLEGVGRKGARGGICGVLVRWGR